jgi:hypothetical protein
LKAVTNRDVGEALGTEKDISFVVPVIQLYPKKHSKLINQD